MMLEGWPIREDQMSIGRTGNEQKVGKLGGHEGVLVLYSYFPSATRPLHRYIARVGRYGYLSYTTTFGSFAHPCGMTS